MSEAKPTPGEWEFRDNEGWTLAIDGVSVMGDAEYYPWVPPHKADWLLFADAGNTYNTTGLTPSQLVERVKELEGALILMVRTHDEPADGLVQEAREQRWLEQARAALPKAHTNTAEGEAQADSGLKDAARESEYQRGYRHGYEQRDAEVRGLLA